MATYQGGCLCGAIRYEATGEPLFSANCHCRDCQRHSGGAFAPAMVFPKPAVKLTGSAKIYRKAGDSGRHVERAFCPECGSQVYTTLEAMPDVFAVKAGTLDDPAGYKPTLNFFVKSAAPWDAMDPALPKLPGSPRGGA